MDNISTLNNERETSRQSKISITTTGDQWVRILRVPLHGVTTLDFEYSQTCKFHFVSQKMFSDTFFLYSWQGFVNAENTGRFNLHVQADVTCRSISSSYHWKWSESPLPWIRPSKICSISSFNVDQHPCFYQDMSLSSYCDFTSAFCISPGW
jgi:hypothetical protein